MTSMYVVSDSEPLLQGDQVTWLTEIDTPAIYILIDRSVLELEQMSRRHT
jgi:hypothetical protein